MKIEIVNTLDDDRPQYRLGDAVLLRDNSCGKLALKYVATNQRHFKGTVLYEYASKIDQNNPEPQWKVLKEVVLKKTKEMKLDLPREDELVVHLRMGDTKGFKQSAELCVDYLKDVINRFEIPISQITLVTAIHFGKLLLENQMTKEQVLIAKLNNIKKIRKIFDLFSEKKLKARLYSHKDIDKDFCFLSNAKYLVIGNGHFSVCAAMVSNAECFIPPWAGKGIDVNIDELLNSRKDFPQYD
ncbi:hypothetical protein ACFL27_19025 [candidate division CSSED10-310 bacterium]|uniref:Uncharacterized protein n=1 Tax=candidate division CSSED10-310 bacterium TaxID=2855610 RepID=A0ABV6Z1G7_UNCC1